MKNFTIIFLLAFLSPVLFAQSPQFFSYQAVIRNSGGELIKSSFVSFRISILKGSETGTTVYTEEHTTQSNENGLVTLKIGYGSTTDDFSTIDWGSDKYFMKVEMDPTGQQNYTVTGTSQLLSVPYALYSQDAENSKSLDGNAGSYYTNAANISNGTLSTDRYSAVGDLTAEGKLDNNNASDILLRSQADARYNKEIAFSAYNSASDSRGAGTFKVEFNAEQFDYGSAYDNVNDQFVAPVKGVYSFSVTVTLKNLDAVHFYLVDIYVNGNVYSHLCYGTINSNTTNFIPLTVSGSATINLNAGNYVEVYVGSSEDSYSIYGSAEKYTMFSGHLVFPDL